VRICTCNMSLSYVGVKVWSTETVDEYGEGQKVKWSAK
jgi:hypothetical protein